MRRRQQPCDIAACRLFCIIEHGIALENLREHKACILQIGFANARISSIVGSRDEEQRVAIDSYCATIAAARVQWRTARFAARHERAAASIGVRGIKRFATLVWRRDQCERIKLDRNVFFTAETKAARVQPDAVFVWRCLAGRNYPQRQVDLNRRDEHFALHGDDCQVPVVTVGLTHGFSLDLKPLLVASLFVSTNSLSLNLGAQRKVGRPRHFLSQENIDNIVSLYNSGEPTSIIAEQFKAGAQRVRNILKEHNIELSPGRRRPFGPSPPRQDGLGGQSGGAPNKTGRARRTDDVGRPASKRLVEHDRYAARSQRVAGGEP